MEATCGRARARLARGLWIGALLACMGQRMAAAWARRVRSTWSTSVGWLPAMGQQFLDSAVGLCRQPREHVFEVGPRVLPVELGRSCRVPNYAESKSFGHCRRRLIWRSRGIVLWSFLSPQWKGFDMSTRAFYTDPKILERLQEGPLGGHIDLYAAKLLQEGHGRQSARHNIRVICDFSHWLARQQLGTDDLDEQTVDRYQQFRRRYRRPFVRDLPAFSRLLAVLRKNNAIAVRAPAGLLFCPGRLSAWRWRLRNQWTP